MLLLSSLLFSFLPSFLPHFLTSLLSTNFHFPDTAAQTGPTMRAKAEQHYYYLSLLQSGWTSQSPPQVNLLNLVTIHFLRSHSRSRSRYVSLPSRHPQKLRHFFQSENVCIKKWNTNPKVSTIIEDIHSGISRAKRKLCLSVCSKALTPTLRSLFLASQIFTSEQQ